jgi:hypothetical protein
MKIELTSRRKFLALQLAGVLTILGLALMVWSLYQPTPLPVMLAMTVGQGLGTLAFLLFLIVVSGDAYRAILNVLKKKEPPE